MISFSYFCKNLKNKHNIWICSTFLSLGLTHIIFNMCNKLYLTVCTFFKDYVLSLLINVIVRYPY